MAIFPFEPPGQSDPGGAFAAVPSRYPHAPTQQSSPEFWQGVMYSGIQLFAASVPDLFGLCSLNGVLYAVCSTPSNPDAASGIVSMQDNLDLVPANKPPRAALATDQDAVTATIMLTNFSITAPRQMVAAGIVTDVLGRIQRTEGFEVTPGQWVQTADFAGGVWLWTLNVNEGQPSGTEFAALADSYLGDYHLV